MHCQEAPITALAVMKRQKQFSLLKTDKVVGRVIRESRVEMDGRERNISRREIMRLKVFINHVAGEWKREEALDGPARRQDAAV